MATTAEMLIMLNDGDTNIRDAIIAKGIAVPESTLFTDLGDKIRAIPQEGTSGTGGWTRPTDRPDVPTIGENEVYVLFAAMPHGINDYALSLFVSGGYSVDWGDGAIDSYASGATAEHLYDYSTLDIQPNTDGIKWVWIKFYISSYHFTNIVMNVRPSWRPAASATNIYSPRIYEMYINAPSVHTFAWSTSMYTRFFNLEVFNWVGTNELTSGAYMFLYCNTLKQVSIDTRNWTTVANMFYMAAGFNSPLDWMDTSNVASFNAFLRGAQTFNQPIDGLDTSNGTNLQYMLNGASSMTFPITIDLSSTTTDLGTYAFANMYGLTSLRLLNMPVVVSSLTVAYTALDATALELLFHDLYDRTSALSGTITITGVAGASALTTAQRAIATNKNWNIVG